MNFSEALTKLKEGNQLRRKGWNSQNQYIELQSPTPESKMTLPYLFIKTVQGYLVPWLASQTDLLADDWYMTTAKE